MNNAVFGKTMENIRKHCNVKLVQNWAGRYGAEARISNPLFKNVTIFDKNLAAVELLKSEVYFNKPIYVGMSILDIAKLTIYDFHYGYMNAAFGDGYHILYTDTDSLIYKIVNHDPYEIMKWDCQLHFDTSDYPQDNIYGITLVNKKVLGMMKDENNGRVMTDFIGLRSKMYVTRIHQMQEEMESEHLDNNTMQIPTDLSDFGVTKKIKDIKKSVIKNIITFNDYVRCVEEFMEKSVTWQLIQSSKHQVYATAQEKIALSPYDDKQYLLPGLHKTPAGALFD